jgi:dephospho-CoA kinase
MTAHRIPRLGLTGGIGSGKSTAAAYLHELGAATVSADDLVQELLGDGSVVARLVKRFGDGVVVDGEVDRAAVARIVFADQAQLSWLEDLLHPLVKRRLDGWAREQASRSPTPSLLVAEVPLLFESDMRDTFDYVLLVTARESLRRRRLAAKLTDSEFSRRTARQLDEGEKAARSDFVFDNSGRRGRLKEYLAGVYAEILAGGVAPRSRRGA